MTESEMNTRFQIIGSEMLGHWEVDIPCWPDLQRYGNKEFYYEGLVRVDASYNNDIQQYEVTIRIVGGAGPRYRQAIADLLGEETTNKILTLEGDFVSSLDFDPENYALWPDLNYAMPQDDLEALKPKIVAYLSR